MTTLSQHLFRALALLLLGAQGSTQEWVRPWTRETIRKRLRRLEPLIQARKMGPTAMCYAPLPPPPEYLDHVCPVCGNRTRHVLDVHKWRSADLADLLGSLPYLRERAREIRLRDVNLDESRLCARCAPPGSQPCLGLVVRLRSGEELRTWDIGGGDLELLIRFSSGLAPDKDRERDPFPSPNDHSRLCELLGELP